MHGARGNGDFLPSIGQGARSSPGMFPEPSHARSLGGATASTSYAGSPERPSGRSYGGTGSHGPAMHGHGHSSMHSDLGAMATGPVKYNTSKGCFESLSQSALACSAARRHTHKPTDATQQPLPAPSDPTSPLPIEHTHACMHAIPLCIAMHTSQNARVQLAAPPPPNNL
jgi:hypothetical protein